jgi:hypothetical protein
VKDNLSRNQMEEREAQLASRFFTFLDISTNPTLRIYVREARGDKG